MGLDILELILNVEDEFDVEIRERDYEACNTVGSLYALVVARRGLTAPGFGRQCPSQQRFLELRRELAERFGVSREQIRPSTPFRDLLGQPLREERWLASGEALGLRLPKYVLPEPWSIAAYLSTLIAFPILLAAFAWSGQSVLLAIPGVIVVGFAWAGLMTILPKSAPSNYTLRSMTYESMEDGSNVADKGDGERERIWNRLIEVVSEQLSVPVDELKHHSRFVEDLGAG